MTRSLLLALAVLLGGCTPHAKLQSACDKLAKSGPAIKGAANAIQELVYQESYVLCALCRMEAASGECCNRAIDSVAEKYKDSYQAVYDLSLVRNDFVQATYGTGLCK